MTPRQPGSPRRHGPWAKARPKKPGCDSIADGREGNAMINLQDIRYLRIGTADLEGAIHFATEIVGLELVAREGKAAYFRSDKVEVRGDTRDHTLVYFEGDPTTTPSASTSRIMPISTRAAPSWRRRASPVRSGTARGMRAAPRQSVHRHHRPERQQDRDRDAALSQRPCATSRRATPASPISAISA